MTQAATRPATHCGLLFSWGGATVTKRRSVGGYTRLTLELPERFAEVGAGQFVLLRLAGASTLPRAFSPMRSVNREIELLIKLEGIVREALGRCPLGTAVEVRGPYGVPYIDRVPHGRRFLLAGGGSGVAPLLHFRDQHPDLCAGAVFGFRTADTAALFPEEELVIEERDRLQAAAVAIRRRPANAGLIACGPEPMLASLAAQYHGDPDVYVSLETRIGCGIGACLGCSIETTQGMRRICRDGPIFQAMELLWPI